MRALIFEIGVLAIPVMASLLIGFAVRRVFLSTAALVVIPSGMGILTAVYLPMGVAVAALDETLAPWTVFRWVRVCLLDYLLYLLLVMVFAGCASTILFFAYAFLGVLGSFLAIFVYQYFYIAQFAMLGTLLRRHRSKLGLSTK